MFSHKIQLNRTAYGPVRFKLQEFTMKNLLIAAAFLFAVSAQATGKPATTTTGTTTTTTETAPATTTTEATKTATTTTTTATKGKKVAKPDCSKAADKAACEAAHGETAHAH